MLRSYSSSETGSAICSPRVPAVRIVHFQRLAQRPGGSLRRKDALDLLAAEPRGGRQLGGRGLSSVILDVRRASLPNACERALRPVREHDRPGQLRDELLHRLADPPGGIRPERRFDRRIEALDRAQQADDALLQELGALNAEGRAVPTGDACDRRQERLDELLARRLVARGRGQHELSLASRREGSRRASPRAQNMRANQALLAAR